MSVVNLAVVVVLFKAQDEASAKLTFRVDQSTDNGCFLAVKEFLRQGLEILEIGLSSSCKLLSHLLVINLAVEVDSKGRAVSFFKDLDELGDRKLLFLVIDVSIVHIFDKDSLRHTLLLFVALNYYVFRV